MKERLKQLHLKARLARDPIGSEAYGAALAAIQEGELRENTEYDEVKQLAVLEKEAGKFTESSQSFDQAGRPEKANHLQRCADLLKALLPAKLEVEAYSDLVGNAIEATGATTMRDMGRVMAALKREHGAALDMKIASQRVKAALG